MSERLHQILRQLDPDNDAQWTSQGLPRLEAVEELMGESVTRKQLTEVDPEFTRESHAASLRAPEQPPEALDPDEGASPQDPAASQEAPLVAEPQVPKPPAPPVESVQHIPDSVDGMREKYTALQREIGQLEDDIKAIQRAIYDRQVACNVLAERVERASREQRGSPIQEYLRSQNALRAQRAERANAAAAAMGAVSVKAPIDRVRQRATGYGNRPTAPRANMAEAARQAKE